MTSVSRLRLGNASDEEAADDGSLVAATKKAIRAASHLTDLDAGTIEAALALARKIDVWDVIVEWAIDDADQAEGNARPAVPVNDNTSLPTYLRYMDALKLTPMSRGVEISEAKEKGKLATMRAVRGGRGGERSA